MKKVLIVDFNATAPTYTHYFVLGLKAEGLEVDVLGAENKSFTAVHEEKINYRGFRLGIKLLDYFLNWIWLFWKAKKYNAIHFQWLPMLKFTSVELSLVRILKKINPNILYTVHNFFPHNSENTKINQRYIKLYKLLDCLAVHAHTTTNKIEELIGQKQTIKINHGYFYSEFKDENRTTKEYELAMLGNILPYKGVEDAIEAVAILKQSGISIKLLIAGKCSAEYLVVLKDLIDKKGLKDSIFMDIGFITVEKLIAYYNTSQLSIMPYKEIEQSGVLYTSLGMGVPVVGYRLGGIAETIVNNQNGFLVPKNEIEQLSDAVKLGLENRNKWRSKILENHSENLWAKNAIILKEIYFK